jgi:hypothetical protein
MSIKDVLNVFTAIEADNLSCYTLISLCFPLSFCIPNIIPNVEGQNP